MQYFVFSFNLLELLKNSIVQINKTTSIASFYFIQTGRELIFQQFYYRTRSVEQLAEQLRKLSECTSNEGGIQEARR